MAEEPQLLASSIKELAEMAELPKLDNKMPVIRFEVGVLLFVHYMCSSELCRYFRSTTSILQQANIHKLEGGMRFDNARRVCARARA